MSINRNPPMIIRPTKSAKSLKKKLYLLSLSRSSCYI